jgi:transcription antitermination factor NusG
MTNLGADVETTTELHWYAIVSRSRHEKLAAAALTNTGITAFLPVVSEMHSWSDRRKLVDVPLFPGYVFVQIRNSPEAQLSVLKTSGVVQFVGNRYGAVSITDKEISDVRTVLAQKLGCSPHPFLQLGQRVRIRGGALDGVEGVLVGRDSNFKLVITIELIQRSLAVSVYNIDVEPIGSCSVGTGDDSRVEWQPGFGSKNLRAPSLPPTRMASVAAAQE